MADGKKISKDTYLFREGDAPDAMYIVKGGELAVTKSKGTTEIVLATLSPGGMVGEMAIFDMKPRSANVKANKDSEVIVLPYDSLTKQLDTLPVWVKAIMKNLNENMREANKKIKMLENANPDAERYPPHVINKLLSIMNYVASVFGTKEGDFIVIPQNRLRNFTIQVFQEPTNKMQSLLGTLRDLGFFEITDLGEGQQKIVNKQPQFFIKFVDWYNDWLFKQEKDKETMTLEEAKLLEGLLFYAQKSSETDKTGSKKINLTDVQNNSMKDLGHVIKVDDVSTVSEKGFVSEKMMQEGGVRVALNLAEIEPQVKYWKLIYDLKKHLR
jgi:hypothetical protein